MNLRDKCIEAMAKAWVAYEGDQWDDINSRGMAAVKACVRHSPPRRSPHIVHAYLQADERQPTMKDHSVHILRQYVVLCVNYAQAPKVGVRA